MTIIRNRETSDGLFRRVLQRDIAPTLAYEATRDLRGTYEGVVTGTGADYHGLVVDKPALMVALPRAAVGLYQAFSNALPETKYGQIDVHRNEETSLPMVESVKVPKDCSDFDRIFVIDPMLATGGSMTASLEELEGRGGNMARTTVAAVISSLAGVAAVHEHNPLIHVVTLALDENLDERKFIIPGLGDAGDRQFGAESSAVANGM